MKSPQQIEASEEEAGGADKTQAPVAFPGDLSESDPANDAGKPQVSGITAAVVAVGSELLGEDRIDTNSLRLASLLRSHGVPLVFKSVVGDEDDRLVVALSQAADQASLVIVTGGLGPTRDDRTREAVSRLTGKPLSRDPSVLNWIEEMYRKRGATMPPTNLRQADVLEGSTVLENQQGTAPGLRFEHQQTTFFLLPGVPREVDGLIASALAPWLAGRETQDRPRETELRVACLPESLVEERLDELYRRHGADNVAVLARPGEVTIRLSAAEESELQAMRRIVENALGSSIFSAGHKGASAPLEEVVLDSLANTSPPQTLATAESCTGGLIGQRLTVVSGSSVVFCGGVVAYSNQIKSELLGVDPELISQHGAVSAPVAEAMAIGARRTLSTDWAVSVTGIAGPGGGSKEKPVGTVWFGLASASSSVSRCLLFPGGRERVRQQASQYALDMLRREVLGLDPLVDSPWMVGPLLKERDSE